MSATVTPFERLRHWLFIKGNRLYIAGGTLLAMFVVTTILDPIRTVTSQDAIPLFYVFGGILSGNLSLLTIVLSINQLVFSRGLESPKKLQNDIEDIAALRHDVARGTGRTIAPIVPSEFLQVLLDSLRSELAVLADAVAETDDELAANTNSLIDSLGSQLDQVERRLRETDGGTIAVLGAMLSFTLSEEMHQVCTLRAQYADRLSTEGLESLESIAKRLQQLNITRNHFESLYTQENHLQHVSVNSLRRHPYTVPACILLVGVRRRACSSRSSSDISSNHLSTRSYRIHTARHRLRLRPSSSNDRPSNGNDDTIHDSTRRCPPFYPSGYAVGRIERAEALSGMV